MDIANQPFARKHSIVRKIWGNADTILFIFAGASAEFALNKAVDWLYFTGRLPADPLGRLFSTVTYARKIVFADTTNANAAIDKITAIHSHVEKERKSTIPDWAYRDVLYMLIYYSIASFELLERKMTEAEKEEVYDVFYRVGARMGLTLLPADYSDWLISRETHLNNDLVKSEHTMDLYKQYRKHLGSVRFLLLRESQKMLLPPIAKRMLGLDNPQWIRPVLPVYKFLKWMHLDRGVKLVLLPKKYRAQIFALDQA
ncbi:MAG: oxygenase MpaB family protein [Sediminibacterium sp.]